MQEYIVKERINGDQVENIEIGKCRPFKLAGGGSTNSYILPLLARGHSRFVIETPAFFSVGVHCNEDQKTPTFSLMCGDAHTSEFLSPINDLLRKRLYPMVLDQLKTFQSSEELHNRRLPKDISALCEEGLSGAAKFWPDLFSQDRDMIFIKVDPNALVVTRGQGSFYHTTPLQLLYKELPKTGIYKARILLRYLFINDPSKSEVLTERRITPNFYVDQIFYAPEQAQAPTHIAMDASSFFPSQSMFTMTELDSVTATANDLFQLPPSSNSATQLALTSTSAGLEEATAGTAVSNMAEESSAAGGEGEPLQKKKKKKSGGGGDGNKTKQQKQLSGVLEDPLSL